MFVKLLLVLPFLLVVNSASAQNYTARQVFTNMLLAMEKMRTAKYTFHSQERVRGILSEGIVKIKVCTGPYRVYMYGVKPNKGMEVLYVAGTNSNEAKVNTHGFPYINLNLDPFGSIMRKNQHHTAVDGGFAYLGTKLRGYQSKMGEDFYKHLSTEGVVTYHGQLYYKLTIDNSNGYGYSTYVAKAGETVTSIATKLHLSDFMVLELNPAIDFYDDVKPGQKLKVPTAYGKKLVFLVSKANNLPLVQYIYDDKGLYEFYELTDFQLNPVFNSNEFSPHFKDYSF